MLMVQIFYQLPEIKIIHHIVQVDGHLLLQVLLLIELILKEIEHGLI
jgi:hypothetical protein